MCVFSRPLLPLPGVPDGGSQQVEAAERKHAQHPEEQALLGPHCILTPPANSSLEVGDGCCFSMLLCRTRNSR